MLAYEAIAVNRMTHSVNLLPMVEEALTHAALDISEIDLFAAVTGPGSFTGVRLGVSTIKGMAHGAGKNCMGVDALEALACGVSFAGESEILCPIQDARVGQVYGAAFAPGAEPLRLLPDTAAALPEYLDTVCTLAAGRRLLFVGDGVVPCQSKIVERLGEQAVFAPLPLNALRPAAVAFLALRHAAEAASPIELKPLYLRAPQAERERARKLGGQP